MVWVDGDSLMVLGGCKYDLDLAHQFINGSNQEGKSKSKSKEEKGSGDKGSDVKINREVKSRFKQEELEESASGSNEEKQSGGDTDNNDEMKGDKKVKKELNDIKKGSENMTCFDSLIT